MKVNDFAVGDWVLYTGESELGVEPDLIGRVGVVIILDTRVKAQFRIPPAPSHTEQGWGCVPDNLKLLVRKEELVHE